MAATTTPVPDEQGQFTTILIGGRPETRAEKGRILQLHSSSVRQRGAIVD